jgi:hypothetical protein
MVNMSDELQERNILKLILIMRFACVTFDVGHPIDGSLTPEQGLDENGTLVQQHYIKITHPELSSNRDSDYTALVSRTDFSRCYCSKTFLIGSFLDLAIMQM